MTPGNDHSKLQLEQDFQIVINNNNNNHNNKLNESANIEKTFTMRLKQQIKQIELNRKKIENRKF